MVTFKVGFEGGDKTDTLISKKDSVSYMPNVGDSIIAFTDRVGVIGKRVFEYDEDGDLTVTFIVEIDKTAAERMDVWRKLAQ